MRLSLPFFIAVLGALYSHAAVCSLLTYNNKGSFLSATSATSIGALPSSGGSGTIVGNITFTNGPSGGVTFLDVTTFISGNQLASNNIENYNIDISGGAFSFGLDAYEPTGSSAIDGCNSPSCIDSTFSMSFFNGASNVGGITFNLIDDRLNFLGIHSDLAFNRVEIREIIGTDDNEFFGNFFTGTIARDPAAAPTPPVYWLMVVGIISIFRARKSRKWIKAQVIHPV